MPTLAARIVVAGTHSGVGKTTVATGLMAALARRGLRVAAAKVGPDFIDPGYHHAATGRPSQNLDLYLHEAEVVRAMAAEAAATADILVVEGVMGLFDGTSSVAGAPAAGSTAEVAGLIGAPVVLVVDASAMSGSVAALVHGFATFDDAVHIAGVVLNRVGSQAHAALLEEALAPLRVPVLGHLVNDDRLAWRERHLGLVPVVEGPDAVRRSLERLADVVAASVDLDALLGLAAQAPRAWAGPAPRADRIGTAVVALASGPAFGFYYTANLALLEQAGAELVAFDPLDDAALPEGCSALYAGGGFPEVFAAEMSANRELLVQLGGRVRGGLPTWAECGGLLLLCESLDGAPMSGGLEGVHARMTERLTIGYREATLRRPGLFGPAGTSLRGHEFHRSETVPAGDALALSGRFGSGLGGFSSEALFASYLHQHLAGRPGLAESFVARACAYAARTRAGGVDVDRAGGG